MKSSRALWLATFFIALSIAACGNSGGDDDDDDDTGDDDYGDLTWQDPPSGDNMTWEEAKAYCDDLSFNGYDDWRLPTLSELRSLIRGCEATEIGGPCGLTDDCLNVLGNECNNGPCNGCDYFAGPGAGGAYWPDTMSGDIDYYWSSSLAADRDDYAWGVCFSNGQVNGDTVEIQPHMRCVR